ncbi:MAG: IclR family transcriptional regulator [Acidobacteriota bacterium]
MQKSPLSRKKQGTRREAQLSASRYHVPALDKGLDILESLASTSEAPTLSELARSLNRSSSELFRMLNALERRGYILKDPVSGSYRLSLKLYELAHTHSPVEELLSAATKPMRALAETIRESCHLSVLSRGQLVVLAQEESPDKVRISVEVGARFSPIHTVSGRLLLAQLAADDLEEFLSASADYGSMGKTKQEEFLDSLEAIRNEGVSRAVNETLIGVQDVAVLVGNPRIGLNAALAVTAWTGPSKSVSLHKIQSALQKCAERITRGVGLTPQ